MAGAATSDEELDAKAIDEGLQPIRIRPAHTCPASSHQYQVVGTNRQLGYNPVWKHVSTFHNSTLYEKPWIETKRVCCNWAAALPYHLAQSERCVTSILRRVWGPGEPFCEWQLAIFHKFIDGLTSAAGPWQMEKYIYTKRKYRTYP